MGADTAAVKGRVERSRRSGQARSAEPVGGGAIWAGASWRRRDSVDPDTVDLPRIASDELPRRAEWVTAGLRPRGGGNPGIRFHLQRWIEEEGDTGWRRGRISIQAAPRVFDLYSGQRSRPTSLFTSHPTPTWLLIAESGVIHTLLVHTH